MKACTARQAQRTGGLQHPETSAISLLCQPLMGRKNCQTADVLLFLKVVSLIEMSSYPWICIILLLYRNRHLNFHLETCPPIIKTTCPISHVAGTSINLLFSFFTFLLEKYRRKKICLVDFWQEIKNNIVRERKRVFLTNGAGTIGINFKKINRNIKPTCYTKFHL